MPLGHDYSPEYTVDKAATCTTDGSESKHCSRCDFLAESRVIKATGHSWNEGTVTTEATYTHAGEMTYSCTICKETRTEAIPMLNETEHSWDNGKITTPATCTTTGIKTYTCENCKGTKTENIPATGHNYDEGVITKEATAEEEGLKAFTCKNCDKTKTEIIPALGESHECDFSSDWQKNESYHWKECLCGKVSDKAGHTWNSGVITKEPTVSEEGVKTYTCIVCRQTKEESLPKKEEQEEECQHLNTVVKNEVESSCKEEGYSGDIYCEDCDELLEKGDIIPKKNHAWDDGVTIKAPTTSEDGYVKYTCTLCEEEKFVKIPKLPAPSMEKPSSGDEKVTDNNKNQISTENKDKNNVSTEEERQNSTNSNKSKVSVVQKTKVSISSVKKSGSKLIVKLKKKSGYKYEIKVSTDKKFKKSVKTYKTSKTTYKTKNLKRNKTYYVKARVYQKIDGKNVYGKWSQVKKVKIK